MSIIEEKENKIEELRANLKGEMFADMEIQDEIFRLKREIAQLAEPLPEKPNDQDIECFNCGS